MPFLKYILFKRILQSVIITILPFRNIQNRKQPGKYLEKPNQIYKLNNHSKIGYYRTE